MGAWLPRTGPELSVGCLHSPHTHPIPTTQGGWPSVSPFLSSGDLGQPHDEWFSHAFVGTVHRRDCGSVWSVASWHLCPYHTVRRVLLEASPVHSFGRCFSNSATCHAPDSPKPAMLGLRRRGQQATPVNSGTTKKQDFLEFPLLSQLPLLAGCVPAGLTFKKALSQWPVEGQDAEEPPGLRGPEGSTQLSAGGKVRGRAPRQQRFQSYFYLLTLQPLNQEFRSSAKMLCFLIPGSYLAKCCL